MEMGTNSPFYPSEAEAEAEAWENYSFDRTIAFEGDQVEQLVHFRSSLYVMPPSQDPPDPAFARARTVRVNALWAGLRRAYFGVKEAEPSHE